MKRLVIMFFLFIISLSQSFQTVSAAETKGWKEKADLPEARVNASSGVVDGKIYIIGGGSTEQSYEKSTFMYDPKTNEWTRKADMPTPRGGAATVTIDHKIYVMGGLSEEGRVNTVEVYDTKTDTWDKIEDLPFDKAIRENYLYAGAIGKKIYVVGFGASSYYAYTYSYDLETKKWEKKEDLKFRNEVRAGDSAVVNNKLYVFGGNNYLLREVYEFDPVSDSWTAKKGGFTQLYPSSAVYNGKILVTGSVFIVRMYDPNTETFSRLSVPKTDYLMAHSSVIVDDTLYIIGGREESSSFVTKAHKNKSVFAISLKDLGIQSENNTGDKDDQAPGDKDDSKTTPPESGSGDTDNQDDEGQALLVVTMINGLQKEYELSMKEVNDFLKWYEARDRGEGPGFYAIDEHDNNKGPFESKKDYVVFKNILMFEVNKYK
ncbi:DUF1668 domain-containing protein [Bacillus haynesii]|uniref:Kelch repeat-containing protein n=1 Tax=Bacillus haynesii TaxID=1925021 RepID=UPI0022821616|nr:DUF1668 domain-containing protein [Bacillus haynesii]MCY8009682.1 DUF1668 domain-containing protein [Bacillus haynesii]MEC0707334.1 DUF1668 domain-containing protein [Bacillus haynesii]MEC0737572.1 DUF1668 domain-containing protein [Bacillus haynesii]